jgi:hypothetical protein
MPHQSDITQGALSVRRLTAALLLLTLAGSFAIGKETQTLKERLSDRASDEQRVNNCRAPTEGRGTAPRSDCPAESDWSMPEAAAGAFAAPKAQ